MVASSAATYSRTISASARRASWRSRPSTAGATSRNIADTRVPPMVRLGAISRPSAIRVISDSPMPSPGLSLRGCIPRPQSHTRSSTLRPVMPASMNSSPGASGG